MAKPAIGFGGTNSTGVYQSLSTLINEFAPELFIVALQVNSPLWASGELEKVEVDEGELTVSLIPAALNSVGFVRDNGKMPLADANQPVKGRVYPSYAVARVGMGRGAAELAKLTDDKLSSYFDSQTKIAANQLARTVGRALYGGSTSPRATSGWSNNTATGDATVSLNFEDISLFVPGMAVDYVDTSRSLSYVVRVTGVTPAAFTNSANVAGTVTFINDVKDPVTGGYVAIDESPTGVVTVATNDKFVIRGQYTAVTSSGTGTATAAGVMPNSFDDIAGAGATADFMGVSTTQIPGWYGQNQTFSSAYTQEALMGLFGRTRALSGVAPNLVTMPPQIQLAHAAATGAHGTAFGQTGALGGAGRITLDNSMDKYKALNNASGITIFGQKVLIDHNLQCDRVILFNTEHVKIANWFDLGPVEQSGSPILVDPDNFRVEYQMQGAFNLYTDLRASVAIGSGFSGL